MSEVAGDTLYIANTFDKAAIVDAANQILVGEYNTIRDAAFPGFFALDTEPQDDLTPLMNALEAALGERPLTLREVDALFDPETGARL